MRDTARLVRDDAGKPKEVVGYWIDVTDRNTPKKSLRRSEAKFRVLIERSPPAIFVQRDGTTSTRTRDARALAYDDPREIIGRTISSPSTPTIARWCAAPAADVSRGKKEAYAERGPACARDGQRGHDRGRRAYGSTSTGGGATSSSRATSPHGARCSRRGARGRSDALGRHPRRRRRARDQQSRSLTSCRISLSSELPSVLGAGGSRARADGRSPRLSVTDIEVILRDAKEGAAARVSGIVRHLRALSRADDETRGPVDAVAVLLSSIRSRRTSFAITRAWHSISRRGFRRCTRMPRASGRSS